MYLLVTQDIDNAYAKMLWIYPCDQIWGRGSQVWGELGWNSNTVLGRRKHFHKVHDTSHRSIARG